MDDSPILVVTGLEAGVADGDLDILKGVDLAIRPGEIHAIMGPNGSGKSTLAKVIAGHPEYEPTGGAVDFRSEDLLEMEPDERAQAGVFMAFQYPVEIPGVSIANFLRTALQSRSKTARSSTSSTSRSCSWSAWSSWIWTWPSRSGPVNDGFSGGREEAQRDPADGGAQAGACGDGRDGLGAGHPTRSRSSPAGEHPEGGGSADVGPADHPLPTDPEPHRPGPGARHGRREDRGVGRPEVALELEAQGYEEYRKAHAA